MAITIRSPQDLASRAQTPEHQEGFIHFLAREGQRALRWAVGLSVAATVFTMIVMFYWAILPAMASLFFFILLLISNFVEERTNQPGDPVNDIIAPERGIEERADIIENPQQHHVTMQVRRRLTRTIAGIVIGIAVAAVMMAGILFGIELLAIGGLIVFAYWLLIAAPLWLGWLNDEAEEETQRAEAEAESIM